MPDSWTMLPKWQQTVRTGKPFTLKFEQGRLLEPSTRKVWSRVD